MKKAILALMTSERSRQFVKFCVVGASGVLVDMAVLHVLARNLGWNVSVSKFCSAELAMLSNFLFNEVWTFRGMGAADGRSWGMLRRLVKFQAICGAGIGFAVMLLNLFYVHFRVNLYLSNLLAILLITLWNFWMNALFNWRLRRSLAPVEELNAWENLKY
ncbi:MAG TPA: GtrA family protein [Verrucomicrobiae bacterium]|nr:GtrA family protein [Verrucomicrobiae bacterium]